MKIRVITYNIHKGVGGLDRRYKLERIIETLEHYRPDIVFMQEVTYGYPKTRRDRQAESIAKALDLAHTAIQANVQYKEGNYGNAIVSRFPLHDVENVDLTVPLKKCRRALMARCHVRTESHSRTLLLSNMHLGLAGFERTMQVKKLFNSDMLKHTHRSTAAIVGGDMNDVWGTLGRRLFEPEGFVSASGSTKTFPAFRPVRPLDRLFFRGNVALVSCHRAATKIASQASDHLPLIADFTLDHAQE